MRLVALGCAAAAALSLAVAPASAAAAEGPVSTQPLGPGEVLLEVSAAGTSRTRADLATFQAHITCRGATQAEASRAADQSVERVTAAARSAGVAPEDITTEATDLSDVPPWASMSAAPEGVPAAIGSEGAGGGRFAARRTMEIRVRDPGRVAGLRTAFREIGIEHISGPTYSLADDRMARRAARADALATARADAEAYAQNLGMRVRRVVRVTERVGTDMFSLLMGNAAMARRIQSAGQSESETVETQMVIGVDFALAPQ